MFGCCCKSSGGKAAILAAIVSAGAILLSAKFLESREADSASAPATSADVVPTGHQPEGEMTPEQMMAMMEEWAAPVEQHELLADMAGTWDCAAKFWMGPEPIVSTGTAEMEVLLGGRFLSQHFVMPEFMGQKFEGLGAIGFDKAKGKYVNVWIDNFGTGMMTMEGEFDDDTHTMTWTGNAVYPVGPGQTMEVPVKHIIKHDGPDKMVMEFWEPNPETGELMRTGEITYTRRD